MSGIDFIDIHLFVCLYLKIFPDSLDICYFCIIVFKLELFSCLFVLLFPFSYVLRRS